MLQKLIKLSVSIAIMLLAGYLGSVFTAPAIQSGWYAGLAKPELAPPNWVFGPMWTALYILIGVSLYIVWARNWKVKNYVWKSAKEWNPVSERLWRGDWQKFNTIAIFVIHYALNVFWPVAFFGIQNPGLAFFTIIALWVSIVYVMINFYRISKLAMWLLIPYLLWVSFAGYLNYSIWMPN